MLKHSPALCWSGKWRWEGSQIFDVEQVPVVQCPPRKRSGFRHTHKNVSKWALNLLNTKANNYSLQFVINTCCDTGIAKSFESPSKRHCELWALENWVKSFFIYKSHELWILKIHIYIACVKICIAVGGNVH